MSRMESDSIGTLNVPADAYYGVQSMRAADNFQITHQPMHPVFIDSIVIIKKAAAMTNKKAGNLSKEREEAIVRACNEILSGKLRDQFIVDAIQGGAGTSANMNVNEVIANRAIEILGGEKGDYTMVHPNDHVNMSQSTNDVIPTAGKLTVLRLLPKALLQLQKLQAAMERKAEEFDDILKMGRTQLQDAVPMRLGQSFHAFSRVLSRDIHRLNRVMEEMKVVNLGGTAIGTAINVSPYYLSNVCYQLSTVTGISFRQAEDLIDATQNLDGFVSVSNALKTCAVNLSKISNDLRLMSSGPKTGIAEINLPARQNGSSIMPGKVNPVIPEMISQVAIQVVGNDAAISYAAMSGQFELNAFLPLIADNLLNSLELLTNGVHIFREKCIEPLTVNMNGCKRHLLSVTAAVTSLVPLIGYEKAEHLAQKSNHDFSLLKKLAKKELKPEDFSKIFE